MIRVFIGYDPKEAVAYNVLAHSIMETASQPVSITPLALPQLRAIHKRERHPLQSTDFSFTRFLTPYLCGFEGWAIFMDCDMLVRDDIAKLWAERDERYAVQVVKHVHIPQESTKFLNQPQSKYEKKNWSSVMLFNNKKCKALTPEFIDVATGLELHQFKWLPSDEAIGELPHGWNHLVGYDTYDPEASLIHYTLGGPYFMEYKDCEYAEDWLATQKRMLHAENKMDASRKLRLVAGSK
jgi:lipopolysaccharide biosynthesis glycosyltransferase